MMMMMITIIITRLPSNLRPTTHECVYLVRRGHVRSRDKYGSHTIRSATVENAMLHANFTALYLLQNRSYCPSKFCTTEIGNVARFWFCDLDLDPMTFIYELGPADENKLSTSMLSEVISLQKTYIIARCHHRKHYHAASCVVLIIAH